jgi:hypothetical protein
MKFCTKAQALTGTFHRAGLNPATRWNEKISTPMANG